MTQKDIENKLSPNRLWELEKNNKDAWHLFAAKILGKAQGKAILSIEKGKELSEITKLAIESLDELEKELEKK